MEGNDDAVDGATSVPEFILRLEVVMNWHQWAAGPRSARDQRPDSDPGDGPPDPGGDAGEEIAEHAGSDPPAEPGRALAGEPASGGAEHRGTHRGRPRSSAADAAIARATLRLLAEVGYEGLSIEGVAAAAGVGKTTVYRRYRSKAELVVSTVSRLPGAASAPWLASRSPVSAREALRGLMTGASRIMSTPGVLQALGALQTTDDPDLPTGIRGHVFGPNIEMVQGVLEEAVQNREIREGAPIDAAIDALWGALVARTMRGAPLDDAWLDSVLDVVWHGLAGPGVTGVAAAAR